MTLDEPFALKHTNGKSSKLHFTALPISKPPPTDSANANHSFIPIVSRPQLAHAGSKQSETASEDYFSLSDGASSNGDDTPYRTPPSRFRSPDLGNGKNASRSLLSLVTSAKRRHQEQPSSSRQDNIGIKRKPVPSRASPPAAPPDPSLLQPPRRTMDEMAPTPGIDDTPYIRFAIEQLTRDEDVRGSRNYESPSNVPLGDDDEIIPDTRRRSIHQDQQRELGQSPPTPPQYPEHTIPENPLTKYDTLCKTNDPTEYKHWLTVSSDTTR